MSIAKENAHFARTWRDKKLAHSDDDVREGCAKVDRASRAGIVAALDSIADVVRWIGSECTDTIIATHPISEISGDEVQFLETVYLGVVEREKRAQMRKELISNRRYEEVEALDSSFPAWLTFRPDDILDG